MTTPISTAHCTKRFDEELIRLLCTGFTVLENDALQGLVGNQESKYCGMHIHHLAHLLPLKQKCLCACEWDGRVVDGAVPLIFLLLNTVKQFCMMVLYFFAMLLVFLLLQLKTWSVALALCLNIGVDPPDVVKTNPCARKECWIGENRKEDVGRDWFSFSGHIVYCSP